MTRTQRKQIPTMSWIFRRLAKLEQKGGQEYLAALNGTGLLKNVQCKVSLADHSSGNHVLIIGSDNKTYATISGFKHDGELYTKYVPQFSATRYRKTLQKWLPFSLPEGSCSWYNYKSSTKPIDLFNADGSVAQVGPAVWTGGRPRKAGWVSDTTWKCDLVIRDSDGKLLLCPNDGEGMFVDADHSINCPSDLYHGFLRGACKSKMEWYQSIAGCLAGAEVDLRAMLRWASQVYNAAARLVEKYPHLKIAMYPMRIDATAQDWQRCDRFGCETRRRFMTPKCNTRFMPAELVVYWLAGPDRDQYQETQEPRWIRAYIPIPGEVHDCSRHNWGRALRNSEQPAKQVIVQKADNAVDWADSWMWCNPTSVFTSIEERELIDSLPLC